MKGYFDSRGCVAQEEKSSMNSDWTRIWFQGGRLWRTSRRIVSPFVWRIWGKPRNFVVPTSPRPNTSQDHHPYCSLLHEEECSQCRRVLHIRQYF